MADQGTASTVWILGEPFRIRGGSPEEVEALARFVDGKLEEIRSRNAGLPLRNLLVLASLNIAEELFRTREEHERLLHGIEDRTRRLCERLEIEFEMPAGVERGTGRSAVSA